MDLECAIKINIRLSVENLVIEQLNKIEGVKLDKI
jgi:hypothetical protein